MGKPGSVWLALLAVLLSQPTDGEGKTEIEFKLRANVIVVDVSVNGREGQFALDTGASSTVISEGFARELGLQSAEKSKALGAGGEIVSSLVAVDSIQVDEAVVKDLTCATMDIDNIGKMIGVPLDGVLGYNFLSKFKVTIDYESGLLTLEPYEPSPAASGFTIDRGTFTSHKYNIRVSRPDTLWGFVTETVLPQIPVILEKRGTTAKVMLTVQEVAGLTIEQAVPSIEFAVSGQVEDYKKISGDWDRLKRERCYVLQYRGLKEGRKMRFKQIFLMRADRLINFNCYASLEEFDSFREDFDRILESVVME